MLTTLNAEWFADLWLLTFVAIGLIDEVAASHGAGLVLRSWRR